MRAGTPRGSVAGTGIRLSDRTLTGMPAPGQNCRWGRAKYRLGRNDLGESDVRDSPIRALPTMPWSTSNGGMGMTWVPGWPVTPSLYCIAPDPARRFKCGVAAEWPRTDDGHPGTV